jgi:hypothetical protein
MNKIKVINLLFYNKIFENYIYKNNIKINISKQKVKVKF